MYKINYLRSALPISESSSRNATTKRNQDPEIFVISQLSVTLINKRSFGKNNPYQRELILY